MYDELIRQFRGKAERCEYDGRPGLARDYTRAADAIEELWTEVKKYRKLRGLWGLKDGGQDDAG